MCVDYSEKRGSRIFLHKWSVIFEESLQFLKKLKIKLLSESNLCKCDAF